MGSWLYLDSLDGFSETKNITVSQRKGILSLCGIVSWHTFHLNINIKIETVAGLLISYRIHKTKSGRQKLVIKHFCFTQSRLNIIGMKVL